MPGVGILKYIKKYKFNSTFIRNLITIFTIVVVPVTLMCGIMYSTSQKSLQNECKQMMKERGARITQISNEFFKSFDLMALTLLDDPKVQNIFTFVGRKSELSEEYTRVMELVNMIQRSRTCIKDVVIYSEINKCLVTANSCTDDIDFSRQLWYKYYNSSKSNTIIYSGNLMQNGSDEITVMRRIAVNNDEVLGMAAITVSTNEYFKMLDINTDENKEIFAIIAEDNICIISTFYEFIGKDIITQMNFMKKNGIDNALLDGVEYIRVQSNSCYNDWNYLYLSRELFYELSGKSMVSVSVGMILVALIMCILIAIYVSVKSFKPLDDIIGYLYDGVEPFETFCHKADNELSYIWKKISSIVNYNTRLNDKMEKTLLLLNKTQICALQHQINPHFIYNTLDVIKWMALDNEQNGAAVAVMVEKLAEVVRYGVDMRSYIVDMREEVSITKSYVDILKIRYENRFDLIWNIPAETLDSKVVKLCLQPVIENAVYHGFKLKRKGGIIHIGAEISEERLNITVSDNGNGMTQKEREMLCRRLETDDGIESTKVGLNNLNMRIKLIYGETCGVRIDSKEGEGTKITLEMTANSFVPQ